eukprot:1160274-Pelagomonas_calceolata.AAC.9
MAAGSPAGQTGSAGLSPRSRGAICLGPAPPTLSGATHPQLQQAVFTDSVNGRGFATRDGISVAGSGSGNVGSGGWEGDGHHTAQQRSWQQEAEAIAAAAINGTHAAAGYGRGGGSAVGVEAAGTSAAGGAEEVRVHVDARFVEPHACRGLQPPQPRPLLWGSAAYRQLWKKAVAAGEVRQPCVF